MPERVQLHRTKGWRKPAGVVAVARPSRWGNPYVLGVDGDRDRCAELYRDALTLGKLAFTVDDVRRELCGRDLACWCPIVDAGGARVACHADVLLEIANS